MAATDGVAVRVKIYGMKSSCWGAGKGGGRDQKGGGPLCRDSCASPDQSTQELAGETGRGQNCGCLAEGGLAVGETEAGVWLW